MARYAEYAKKIKELRKKKEEAKALEERVKDFKEIEAVPPGLIETYYSEYRKLHNELRKEGKYDTANKLMLHMMTKSLEAAELLRQVEVGVKTRPFNLSKEELEEINKAREELKTSEKEALRREVVKAVILKPIEKIVQSVLNMF